MTKDMGVLPSGSGCQPAASAVPASRSGIPNAEYVRDLVTELANAGDSACLHNSPMIPLHKDTVRMIADMLSKPEYPPICGYPIPGWQLGFVQFDEGKDGQPSGWIVKLMLESPSWALNRREYNVMARSDLGPLEAWEEAIRIARRSDERAQAIEARRAETENTGSVHESAVGETDAPTLSTLTEHPGAKQND